MSVAALVLAAGGTRRLGQPKQLLAYRGATLLDATLHAEEQIRRIQAWLQNQIKHRSVHSLLVPT